MKEVCTFSISIALIATCSFSLGWMFPFNGKQKDLIQQAYNDEYSKYLVKLLLCFHKGSQVY